MRAPTLTAAALLALALPRADALGAGESSAGGDHPMISRYPGQEIRWRSVENFRPYKVPAGPVIGYRTIGDWIETEGRVTRIFYVFRGEDRSHDEIFRNYAGALEKAGFEILGAGAPTTRMGAGQVGGRTWQGIVFAANPWQAPGSDVNTLLSGTSTQGGSAAVVARVRRAAGTAYVVVNIEQHSRDTIGTLVDIIEEQAAETDRIVVDAAAIGRGMADQGRVVLDGIQFEFDAATIRPESKPALDAIAEYLAANPVQRFYIVGHTDAVGSFAYNRELSADRARAVAEALTQGYGIASARLEPHGVGPLVPVFSNESDAGRDQNRRVELVERP